MVPQRTDRIIIVGGRFSGALLAAMLARHGENVLVLDRSRVSTPTVSIALMCPDVLAILDTIGFGTYLDGLNYARINHLDMEVAPGIRVSGSFPSSFGRHWGYALRRETLDRLLLDYVRNMFDNVDVREELTVERVEIDGERVVGLLGRSRDGKAEAYRGDLVVGADGRHSFVAKAVGAETYDQRTIRTCFYYSYFRNVASKLRTGSLVSYHGSADFQFESFSQDAEDGLTGIGIQASEASFPLFKRDVSVRFHQCLNSIPELRWRLANASQVAKISGLLVPRMYKRRPYGAGWNLVGDAALHVNPVTGQGLSLASYGAASLSRAIREWRSGSSFEEVMASHQARRDGQCHHNYERAAQAADIDAPIEPWRHSLYQSLAANPEHVTAWLRMLSNAMPPETFLSADILSAARARFEARTRKDLRPRLP